MRGRFSREHKLLCTLLLMSLPSLSVAGNVRWGRNAQTATGSIEVANHLQLSYRVRTQRGRDGMSDVEITIQRKEAHPNPSNEFVLYEGVGTASAEQYQFADYANGGVTVTFPSGDPRNPEDVYTRQNYIWSNVEKKLLLESSFTEDVVWNLVQQSFRALDPMDNGASNPRALGAALSELRKGHPTYFTSHRNEIVLAALRAVHRAASKVLTDGSPNDAATIVAESLFALQDAVGERQAHPDRVRLCATDTATPCTDPRGLSMFVIPDASTAVMLNDLGYLLEQGGNPNLAVFVLLQVVQFFPQRAAAHLNLADAAWAAGVEGLARDHYSRFLELRANASPERIPSRARERANAASTPSTADASRRSAIVRDRTREPAVTGTRRAAAP